MKHAFQHLSEQLKYLIAATESETSSLNDYLTDDIANEWIYDYYAFFIDTLEETGIDVQVLKKEIVLLCENFSVVSKNGKKYDEEIWTLEGLKKHPFWQQQKILAQKILCELNKMTLQEF